MCAQDYARFQGRPRRVSADFSFFSSSSWRNFFESYLILLLKKSGFRHFILSILLIASDDFENNSNADFDDDDFNDHFSIMMKVSMTNTMMTISMIHSMTTTMMIFMTDDFYDDDDFDDMIDNAEWETTTNISVISHQLVSSWTSSGRINERRS